MSMAAGEYVSVNSQSDTERADLAREKAELKRDPVLETGGTRPRSTFERGLDLPPLGKSLDNSWRKMP